MYLTDNPVNQQDKHKISPLSFIDSNGFVVYIADNSNEPGHLNFRLSADTEMVGLFDAQLKEIDKVIYGPQTTDVSYGRAPNGAENFEFFVQPTPGVSNPPSATVTLTNLIAIDGIWSYEQSDAALLAAWTRADYNDSLWSTGQALLYVEESNLPAPANTPLTLGAMTYYFRTHFNVDAEPDDITHLRLTVVIDDGAVVWLNGKRLFCLGMPWGTIEHTTRAGRSVDRRFGPDGRGDAWRRDDRFFIALRDATRPSEEYYAVCI